MDLLERLLNEIERSATAITLTCVKDEAGHVQWKCWFVMSNRYYEGTGSNRVEAVRSAMRQAG